MVRKWPVFLLLACMSLLAVGVSAKGAGVHVSVPHMPSAPRVVTAPHVATAPHVETVHPAAAVHPEPAAVKTAPPKPVQAAHSEVPQKLPAGDNKPMVLRDTKPMLSPSLWRSYYTYRYWWWPRWWLSPPRCEDTKDNRCQSSR